MDRWLWYGVKRQRVLQNPPIDPTPEPNIWQRGEKGYLYGSRTTGK